MVSLVSSPGAGKTTLLERTLGALKPTHRVAALVGDLQTDNDARRLANAGVPVRQIDLALAVAFDRAAAHAAIQDVRHGIEVLEVSAKTGEGFDAWVSRLQACATGGM